MSEENSFFAINILGKSFSVIFFDWTNDNALTRGQDKTCLDHVILALNK